jgi:diaminopimelate dehydrogenase
MRRQRIAIVGFGRLGQACGAALQDVADLELAGVVRRETSPRSLPAPFRDVTVARDVSELGEIHAALVCVPTLLVRSVAEEILKQRIAVIECARLDGDALAAHHKALDTYARSRKVGAVVGAGWDPGAVQLFQRLFGVFIPVGQTALSSRPGVNLHHTAAAEGVADVAGALATQFRGADGRVTHYVYVELAPHADLEQVTKNIVTQPAFVGEHVIVLPVDSIAALEATGHGAIIERRGISKAGPHPTLLLEARFDVHAFAARVMVDAVRLLPAGAGGAIAYTFSL